MLKYKKNNLGNILSRTGKAVSIIIGGTIFIHFVVTFSRSYIFSTDIITPLTFIKSVFSKNMIPILVAYAILIFTAYNAWNKMKLAMLEANKLEVQIGQEEAVIQTTQEISGLMAEHITNYNNDIRDWMEKKKNKGQQVPEKLENASIKISRTLEKLTQTGFVFPYTEDKIKNINHYIEHLQKNLSEIAED